MTQQNSLEVNGTLAAYPLGELIVEIGQARLSGSLRVAADNNRRTIIYFHEGAVVYAVSNQRQHRLFAVLADQKKVHAYEIAGKVDPVNDVELSAFLIREGLLEKDDLDAATIVQLEAVLIDALSWTAGDWHFSPLARVRQELHYPVSIHRVLTDYARCLPLAVVTERFRSVEEAFSVNVHAPKDVSLLPHEEDIARRFGDLRLTISDIRYSCPMPEEGLFQALFTLWLGGKLIRHDWNAAFPPSMVNEMHAARLAVTKKAAEMPAMRPAPQPAPAPEQPAEPAITLEEYLARVEGAATHYDVLGIEQSAELAAVKQAYFMLAKLFHPDRYHKEAPATVARVQSAFTKLAHANDTLKTRDGRSAYDLKLRRERELRDKRTAAGQPASGDIGTDNAFDSFEQGKASIAAGDPASAITHFARAVHYAPQNATYKAWYGKALSADERQRFKAESEFQAAVKLEPKNAEIRIMLAEFYLSFNMTKRAEGELKRFLEAVPGQRDATAMLARISRR